MEDHPASIPSTPSPASNAITGSRYRSMVGDGVDHGAAMLQLHTGVFQFKRPSMGSWTLYGLGTENQDLPGFITIKPVGHGGQNKWSSSFLPGEYQGTPIGSGTMKVEEI